MGHVRRAANQSSVVIPGVHSTDDTFSRASANRLRSAVLVAGMTLPFDDEFVPEAAPPRVYAVKHGRG
jgi:hypothetical protein